MNLIDRLKSYFDYECPADHIYGCSRCESRFLCNLITLHLDALDELIDKFFEEVKK